MKIIEAMKQAKDLLRKADDLVEKIKKNCVLTSVETPAYPDQKVQVSEWLQAHSDVVKEILRLRTAIQRTNISTPVTIELGGKQVTKSIAEWIQRRKDLASLEFKAWNSLNDRGIKEGTTQGPSGTPIDIKVIRYYDPKVRDEKLDLFSSEPALIDGKLEIVNAVTDLIE